MGATDVWVTASFTAREGKADALAKQARLLVGKVQREPGCLKYDCYLEVKNPLEFTIIEHWASQADLDVHSNAEALQWWAKAAADLREPAVVVKILKDLPGAPDDPGAA